MFRKKSKTLPTTPVEYPPGTFIKSQRGYYFIADRGKRYRILSERVLNSWSPARVVETTEAAVQNYKVVAKLKFRNGSLIHNLADGRIYLIVNQKRCHVESPDVLTRVGATDKDIIHVSNDEIKLHELGEALS